MIEVPTYIFFIGRKLYWDRREKRIHNCLSCALGFDLLVCVSVTVRSTELNTVSYLLVLETEPGSFGE